MDFDPERTLIGGPNESGKSTLIEAVHRALFLKAQVTGEPQRSMVSRTYPGHPEVELEFEVQGVRYHLLKRFSGQSGIARLTRAGGSTWHAEEAETALRDLLGVPDVGGGRGVGERVRQQWAHLWVWQGTSTQSPCHSIREQNDRLLQELQRRGGAVVMQSELDGRVAAEFAEKATGMFVSGGRPRAGSDLDRAAREKTEAQTVYQRSTETLDALRQTVAEYEEADATISRTTKDLVEIEAQLKAVSETLTYVESLRRQKELQEKAVQDSAKALDLLEKAEDSIRRVQDALVQNRSHLRPEEGNLRALEDKRKDLEHELNEAWRAYEAAIGVSRNARRTRDLALARVTWFEQDEACRRLEETSRRVSSLEEEIEQARRKLARLPGITEQVLNELRRLEAEAAQAEAALSGMAAEIEAVDAGIPVVVAGEVLAAGRSRTVTEPTEVRVGDSVTLRIRPGGGLALAQARERLHRAAAVLRDALETADVDSPEKAAEVWSLRRALESDIIEAEATLRALLPEDQSPATELQSAQEGRSSAEAEIERLTERMGEVISPSTRVDAQAGLREQEKALPIAEDMEAESARRWEDLKVGLEQTDKRYTECREAVARLKSGIAVLEVEERLLLEAHGNEQVRGQELAAAHAVRSRAQAILTDTRRELERLQPAQQEADHDRLERAQTKTKAQHSDAVVAKEVAWRRLRTEGAEDPYAVLALAEADFVAASEHHEAVRRDAEAVRLLDRLFSGEQRVLSERLSRPLAEVIESYVQCVFGPDTQVTVGLNESGVTGIEVIRSGEHGATDFNSLSEGAKEQVAAAVRLAIAQLLVTNTDEEKGCESVGSLPVVFDDAFAYSDPERVHTLQRMLDLAALRGLQVIVLTCNPSDYASLGAKEVVLRASV